MFNSYAAFVQSLPVHIPTDFFTFAAGWQAGGFGRVYRATVKPEVANPWGLEAGTACALKLFAPVGETERVGPVPRWRYVAHELQITERFGRDTPLACLPEYKGAFMHAGGVVMILEWIDGRDLHYWHNDLHRREIRITEEMAAKLIRNVLTAVNELHNGNIAHRDIKPENIMVINDDLDVRIIDLSFAKWIAVPTGCNYVTETTEAVLVPPGMAPHNTGACTAFWAPTDSAFIIAQRDLPKLDCWAVGLITLSFFFSIQRRLPDWRWAIDRIAVSAALKNFLLRMLAPDPADRYAADDALADPWITAATPSEQQPAGERPADAAPEVPSPDIFTQVVGEERDRAEPGPLVQHSEPLAEAAPELPALIIFTQVVGEERDRAEPEPLVQHVEPLVEHSSVPPAEP